jgi:hypothetical protein
LEEIPNVVAAYKKYKSQGFEIVGISLDDAKDLPKFPAFLKSHNMTWRQIADGKNFGNPIAKKYELQGIPFMLLIGRDGKIAAVNPRGDALTPALEKALKAK